VDRLTLEPIGVIHSPLRDRMDAPRQPRAAEGIRGTIELFSGHNYEDALGDLAGFDYIWVVFWFHLNDGWRPKVLPPRSDVRRGVFATRAPHRPNPIGLSALRLESVDGLVLHVSDLDLLDGTPVLDIKPYIAWTDAIGDARSGWLGERPPDPKGSYSVSVSARAREQLAFLRERGIDLETPARATLALGPHPHAYRRIRGTTLSVHEWRVHFKVEGANIEIDAISSGYRADQLDDHPIHRAFMERHP
jgi:tRNA-Thr(GGU) m(6)t(6)A37 methyltransferase TsaA